MYSFVLRVAGLTCILGIAATQASACQCSGIHGKNAWEIAKLEKESAAVIFEGTSEHFDFQWSVLKANPGDLIPSDLQTWRDDGPRMIVTFRVQRAYKGQLGSKVQMNTGLGGGAQFAPGLTYLVYGFQTLHELNTSMCSPGGWIGGADNVGSELRYLRNERPTSADLLPLKPWAANESTAKINKGSAAGRKSRSGMPPRPEASAAVSSEKLQEKMNQQEASLFSPLRAIHRLIIQPRK